MYRSFDALRMTGSVVVILSAAKDLCALTLNNI